MHSILTITEKATDLSLLSIEEMRAAVGVADDSQDAALQQIQKRVAAAIVADCAVAIGKGASPTLLRETCSERFYRVDGGSIYLSRRHEVEITSVTVDGIVTSSDGYDVEPESGELAHLIGGVPCGWCGRVIDVVYFAGFEEAPDDLKMAASDFMRLAWQEGKRDPALKSREVDVPDVQRIREDYWVGSVPGQSSEGAVPDVVAGQLARFRNTWVR